MRKYHVIEPKDVTKAGLPSLWDRHMPSSPPLPILERMDLPGERVAIQEADYAVLVGPVSLSNPGAETKLSAENVHKFLQYHGLRPAQLVVIDLDTDAFFDWRSPAPMEWDTSGVRFTVGQISVMHSAKMQPIYDALAEVKFFRTMPRKLHQENLRVMALPNLSGDYGGEDREPTHDVAAQVGTYGMRLATTDALREWVAKTSVFAPGKAREMFAMYDINRQKAAMGPRVVVGREEGRYTGGTGAAIITHPNASPVDWKNVDEAREALIALNEEANVKLRFTAAISDHLSGDAMRTGRAVVVASDHAELPGDVWAAFSAGRSVFLIGPDPVLPFADQIDYSDILVRVPPEMLPKLGTVLKTTLNAHSPESLAAVGRKARAAYETARNWRELLVESLAT